MLLVTWNVNSLKARMPRVLELLAQHRPDAVCVQETKCAAEAFPHEALADAGYLAVDHSGGRWAGVAILAPMGAPLEDPRAGLPGEPDPDEARWIEATVAGVRVASAYVPNGRAPGTPTFDAKLRFLDAMAGRAAELTGDGAAPVAIAGDMNVAPADIDVYDPSAFAGETHVTPPEREGLRRVLDAGLRDAYRELHPGEPGFTWWDYRQGHFHRGMGMRIDLALLSPELSSRVRECGIDRDYRKGPKPSDHAPLLVEIA